jgi:hypothetical protein
MPYLTSKALLTDVEGMSFLRAVLQPSRRPAAIPQPMQSPSALKTGQQSPVRAEKRVLVAGS